MKVDSLKSEILRKGIYKSLELNKKSKGMDKDAIEKEFSEAIKECEKELKNYKEYIQKIDNQKRELLRDLRLIMEEEKNHIDNLLSKELKQDKKEEYQKKEDELNDLMKNQIEKNDSLYNKNKGHIKETWDKKIDTEKKFNKDMHMFQDVINEGIERGRRGIFEKCILILKDNEMTEEGIKHFQDELKEIKDYDKE